MEMIVEIVRIGVFLALTGGVCIHLGLRKSEGPEY